MLKRKKKRINYTRLVKIINKELLYKVHQLSDLKTIAKVGSHYFLISGLSLLTGKIAVNMINSIKFDDSGNITDRYKQLIASGQAILIEPEKSNFNKLSTVDIKVMTHNKKTKRPLFGSDLGKEKKHALTKEMVNSLLKQIYYSSLQKTKQRLIETRQEVL